MLSKAKEELEAEKRELVRTLERRALEVEHLNGMSLFLYLLFLSVTQKCFLVTICVLIASPDDLRQLNDKLVEVNSSKMALQMKLDELEAAEVNIKVSCVLSYIFF